MRPTINGTCTCIGAWHLWRHVRIHQKWSNLRLLYSRTRIISNAGQNLWAMKWAIRDWRRSFTRKLICIELKDSAESAFNCHFNTIFFNFITTVTFFAEQNRLSLSQWEMLITFSLNFLRYFCIQWIYIKNERNYIFLY